MFSPKKNQLRSFDITCNIPELYKILNLFNRCLPRYRSYFFSELLSFPNISYGMIQSNRNRYISQKYNKFILPTLVTTSKTSIEYIVNTFLFTIKTFLLISKVKTCPMKPKYVNLVISVSNLFQITAKTYL